MIDNFGKGGFGLDQLTELIPGRLSENERQQTIKYLSTVKNKLQDYLMTHPEVVEVHAVPQPHNHIRGVAYGETYLDENGSKNMRIRIK